MSDATRKDPLESPGVPPKPVLIVAAGTVVFLVVMLALLGWFFVWRVQGSAAPQERTFPAPRLETSIAPRAVRVETHGPSIPEPTRQLDPRTKPTPLASSQIPLEQAMAIIAGRGVHAYDPVTGPPTPAQGGGR